MTAHRWQAALVLSPACDRAKLGDRAIASREGTLDGAFS
jgi:hypothetical protein